MIFTNLTVFQNVLFIIACVSLVLLITYLILLYTGYVKTKNKVISDDIDDITDDFEPASFVFNTFKIKGTVFALTIGSTCSFLLSLFATIPVAITISVVLAIGIVLILGYLEREPLANKGEIGIVTEAIPEKSQGMGRVLLIETDSEVDAESTDGAIKKGKKVIIVENIGNKVIVKKFKRSVK